MCCEKDSTCIRHTWLVTNGFGEEQIYMFQELSSHDACRRLLGPALPSQPKVDLQWQSTKLESTRALINWMKQALYTTALDSSVKQSLKTSMDPKDVVTNTQALKDGLDDLLAVFKKESGPKCPAVPVEEPKPDSHQNASATSVDLGDLVTSQQLEDDRENELPRWVDFLEEMFDKWITLVLHDSSSVTLAQNLSLWLAFVVFQCLTPVSLKGPFRLMCFFFQGVSGAFI